MPTKQILDLGTGGVAYDTPQVLLPENVFSDVRNVRFKNNAVGTITGEARYAQLLSEPNHGIHWRRPDGDYNIFVRDGSIQILDATAAFSSIVSDDGGIWFDSTVSDSTCVDTADWTCPELVDNLTDSLVNTFSEGQILNAIGADYTLGLPGSYSNVIWQSTTFNGGYSIVLNDGINTPLFISYDNLTPIESEEFLPFPGWNYNSAFTVSAKVIRPLNYSLVAGNLTLTDSTTGKKTYAPSTLRISTQAAPGSFPQVWEPGLTTDTADEFELNTTGPILDMLELRGSLFVYSEDNIHMVTTNTGVTRVQPYSSSFGILNTDCVVEFEGNHFVVDRNDIYVHNGSGTPESIADTKIREYFFNNLDYNNSNKVFVKRDKYNHEIWICYPKGVSVTCNEALIYNHKNNTWTVRDLPKITYMFNSISVRPYEDVREKNTFIMLTGTPLVLATNDGFKMLNTATLADESYVSFIRKERINSGDLFGSLHISSMTPVFDQVPANEDITISVLGTNTFLTDLDWNEPRSQFVFKPNEPRNQGYKVDPRTSGRFLSYDIRSNGPWRLALIGIDVAPKDRR